MVRTAEALREFQASSALPGKPVPHRHDFDVATVIVAMASRLAGVPLRHAQGSGGTFTPPPAPGHFRRHSDRRADSEQTPRWLDRLNHDVPFADADRVAALREAVEPGLSGDLRPVVVAAPSSDLAPDLLPGVLETLAAVTLELDAAWALEPMAAAFVATARWVRPTLLVAPALALDALAEAWDGSDARWSRLGAVVVPSPAGAAPSQAAIERWQDLFACPVRIWGSHDAAARHPTG